MNDPKHPKLDPKLCKSLTCGDDKKCAKGRNDLGQEYCEFHAVQEGGVVDKVAKSNVKPAKVECLFTGVYADVKGNPGGSENQGYGQVLNKALTDGDGNLKDAKGASLPALGQNPFAVMNGRFNSRGAATALLQDCQAAAGVAADAKRVNDASDEVKCSGDGSGCASARDIEACTLIVDHGVGWRNSDPVICGRAARGALCGDSYSPLPPALEGFLMTAWDANVGDAASYWAGKSDKAPSPPDKCRYAKVNGRSYLHLLICDPDDTMVTNPKYEGNLQQMCSDVFGPKIAMTAPVGAVAKIGGGSDAFCSEFNDGVKTLQGLVSK
jgi:hypothetical protein